MLRISLVLIAGIVALAATQLTMSHDAPTTDSPAFARLLDAQTANFDAASTGATEDETAIIWNPASASLTSGCVGSLCLGSGCVGSGCLGSACGVSGCNGSGCLYSGCLGSACVVTSCFGSFCAGSGCNGSMCHSTPCVRRVDSKVVQVVSVVASAWWVGLGETSQNS
ncbi:MAG: hypothetical protein KDB53_05060 [Planctomycetes bacterium]|nr:hypothetical protein [Planctomycetota bacterium]